MAHEPANLPPCQPANLPPCQPAITPAWTIELQSDSPVARFAARELQQTLQRMGGPCLPIVAHAAAQRIALRCGADGDSFMRCGDVDGLVLRGDGPRGLLYAVYDLLEALGCRWVTPDPAGEYLPHVRHVQLPGDRVARQPAFPGRCLVIGHNFFLEQAEEWIIWAARNRINTIFIHTTDARLALGACRLRYWRERRDSLLPMLQERGMLLELGGHGLAGLIPRRLFVLNRAMFRHDGRRRTPRHNFCPSHPATRQLLRTNGAALFQAYPEVQIFHIWPDDLRGGGWCHCSRCAGLSASEQALIATNVLAETLAVVHPQARLAHLAYHDTTEPPRQVSPHPNVVLAYAPRSRSYARGIDDPDSPVNRPFFAALGDNIAHFHRPEHTQRSWPAAPRVFEYYLDGILFKSAPPPLPAVLQQDMRAYRAAGVHTVQALMTGDRPWRVAPVNAYLFARLAWDAEQSPEALLRTCAAVRAPRVATALEQCYLTLARAWQPVLDFQPAEQRMAAKQPVRRDLCAHPPTDILDYMAAPYPLREQRLQQITAGNALLDQSQVAWLDLLRFQAELPHLAAEYAEWELSVRLLRHFLLRQRLYVLADRGATRVVLQDAYDDASAAWTTLVRWGHRHLPPHTRASYDLFRWLARLHLDGLWDRRLASRSARIQLRMHTYGRLAWLVWRLTRP